MTQSTEHWCPNCSMLVEDHDDYGGCILAVFAEVILSRGDKSEEEVRDLVTKCNVDALWSMLGPVIDSFEDGCFSQE